MRCFACPACFFTCLASIASLVMFVLRAVYTIKLKCFDEPMICIVWYFSPQGMIHIYIRHTQIRHRKTLMVNLYIVFNILHVTWRGIILHHLNVTSFCYRDTDRGLEVTLSFPDLRCMKYINDHYCMSLRFSSCDKQLVPAGCLCWSEIVGRKVWDFDIQKWSFSSSRFLERRLILQRFVGCYGRHSTIKLPWMWSFLTKTKRYHCIQLYSIQKIVPTWKRIRSSSPPSPKWKVSSPWKMSHLALWKVNPALTNE